MGATRRAQPRAALGTLLLFLCSLGAVATRPHTADEIEYFSFLRSAWFDRDLSFENEYRYFYEQGFTSDPQFKATFIDRRTPTGHAVTYATIGCALLWSPFYLAADLAVRIARLAGASVAADGFSWPYLAAVAYGSACYGALALVISAAIARRVTGRGAALAALAVFAGTPLVFYMYVMPLMAHACSAFVVAAFVWAWLKVRTAWTLPGVALLAAAGAVMAMVREQEAFVVFAPAVDYLWSLAGRPEPRRRLVAEGMARLAIAALAFTLAAVPQIAAYLLINGRLAPSPDVAQKMYWTAPWAPDVVLSPAHGWFFWTPLAAVALAGLAMMTGARERAAGRIGLLLLLTVATQIYVSGSVLSWTLAGAFGQRRFIGMTVTLVVGLAWLLSRAGRWRGLAVSAVAVAIWWNLGLAVQFGEHSMDRQRLDLARNARATFVELPRRLPQIAYRYLFDRRSFYEPRSSGRDAGP